MDPLEKEYHPIIEGYVTSYVDKDMSEIERETFKEVLVVDKGLRELVSSAKDGKKLIGMLRLLRLVYDN